MSQATFQSRRLAVGRLLGLFAEKDNGEVAAPNRDLIDELKQLLNRDPKEKEAKEDRQYLTRPSESYQAHRD